MNPNNRRRLIGLALFLAAAAMGAPRPWMLGDGSTVWGEYRTLRDGAVVVAEESGKERLFPFDNLQQADRRYAADREAAVVLPSNAPPWAAGYKIRYALRVAGDMLTATSRTVIARLPTGGWLKPDASDLLVQTASGKTLPALVLSHDPRGYTVIQFICQGMDRWYWVYAINPNPRPQIDPALRKKLDEAAQARDQALLAKMKTQKETAEASEKWRDLKDRLDREAETAAKAAREAASWEKLLPERQAAIDRAAAAEPAATQAVARTEAAALSAAAAAAEKTNAVAAARLAVEGARQAAQAAIEKARTLTAAAAVAMDAGQSMQKAGEAEAARLAAVAAAAQASNALEQAEQAALPVRVAAAQAQSDLETARKNLSDNRAASAGAVAALEKARQALAEARALQALSEGEVAKLQPGLPPLAEAVARAQAASSSSVQRAQAMVEAHRVLGETADPAIHQEGLTAEFRDWKGDQVDELSDWPRIVRGLEKSDNVIGNAVVTEVLQNMNPFRPDDPRDFASSYRGSLRIAKPGIYRFFVNGDDAAFLFVNGFKVYSRSGSNVPVRGKVPLYAVGADIELEAGQHPFEIHQVVGHTPGAQGVCTLMWLTPGSKDWKFVPAETFTKAAGAVVTTIEAQDGSPVPTVEWGVDDTLSAGGAALYLVRFEAGGAAASQTCSWTLGDGLAARGRSLTHLYFKEGDCEVSVQGNPAVPPFRRRIHVWPAPGSTSPLSPARAVAVLGGLDLKKLDPARLNAGFDFLLRCGQTNRWPVLERVAQVLLERPPADLKYKVLLMTSLMEALARQGRGAEALKMQDAAMAAAGKNASLQADVLFAAAEICRRQLRDFDQASALYGRLIDEFRRRQLPRVREAAAAWGDLYLESENMSRAGECYRLAASLGEPAGGVEGGAEASTRGALLRVAEQQLREGNIRQTWRLLEKIEQNFPEQKLEGLYRLLRGESDRYGGRYEEAIGHYEALLKLRQWSAFRPQAMQGLADSYFRAGDSRQSLGWYDKLAEAYPDYAAAGKIAPLRKMAADRLAREEAARAAGTPLPAVGAVSESFSRTVPVPLPGLFRFRPTLGIDGTDTVFFDFVPDSASQAWGGAVSNIQSRGVYWFEVWYRNSGTPPPPAAGPHLIVRLFGSDQVLSEAQTVAVDRSYGEWRKLAGRIRAPLTADAAWSLSFVGLNGITELDGLRILPVTDAQEEALRNFIEGAGP